MIQLMLVALAFRDLDRDVEVHDGSLPRTQLPGASSSTRMRGLPGRRRCGLLVAGARCELCRVVVPPEPLLRPCVPLPVLRVEAVVVADLIAGLGVAGRVDQRRDVPAGGQHEPGLAAEQLAAAVAGLPWADVVGYPRAADQRASEPQARLAGE